MFAALLAAAFVAPAPPPLKVIAHERSSPFCTVMRENVRSALLGLLANDDAIAKGKPVYVKMAHDFNSWGTDGRGSGHRSASMHMDVQRVETIVGAIVHNLEVIDALLRDPVRFPPQPRTGDDRMLDATKAQISAVEDEQRRALNVLSGSIDTYELEDLLGRGNGLGGALGKEAGGSESDNFFACGPTKTLECEYDPELAADPIFENSPFMRFHAAIARYQDRIAAEESPAAQNILANMSSCR